MSELPEFVLDQEGWSLERTSEAKEQEPFGPPRPAERPLLPDEKLLA